MPNPIWPPSRRRQRRGPWTLPWRRTRERRPACQRPPTKKKEQGHSRSYGSGLWGRSKCTRPNPDPPR
eukprot:608086-Prorocentrum_lima.AAC.1